MKVVFESSEPIKLVTEDSGCAMLVDGGDPEIQDEDSPNTMWVQIGSWDDNGHAYPDSSHIDIRRLEGKKVRITLEVID